MIGTDALLTVSYVALWALVLTEVLLLFGLMRQIGMLHIRIADVGTKPIDLGLPVHTRAPDFSVRTLDGRTIHLAELQGSHILLMFVAPNCVSCQEVIPHTLALRRLTGKRLQVLLVSRGGTSENRQKFLLQHGIKEGDLLLGVQEADEVARLYRVNGTPFGFVLDDAHVIQSKGIPTSGFFADIQRSIAQSAEEETPMGDSNDRRHIREHRQKEVMRSA